MNRRSVCVAGYAGVDWMECKEENRWPMYVSVSLSRLASPSGMVKHFDSLPDPRQTRNRRHLLMDVIAISVCGAIVGCQGPTSIERWAKAKRDWLATLLELPNGIPLRDCIRRVLSTLKPAAFQKCFRNWIAACLLGDAEGSHRTIAIGGKTMRRSHDKAAGLGPLHIASAWASERGLALGQLATAEKSNEITGIGASRIPCTGCSTSRSTKTRAGRASGDWPTTFPGSAASPSAC